MAAEFIRCGHTVFGCGRNTQGIAELRERYGSPHRFQVVDVGDDRQVAAWAGQLLKDAEPPDLLINNAALVNRNAVLWEIAAEEFSSVIDVNIKGVANLIRHFVPAMIARGNGVIVNFSSGWGRATSAHVSPYCASKWAIEGLTRAMAQELPRGMAAIPLNPGIIDTDMLRTSFGEDASGYPSPDAWAKKAVPFILRLGVKDNGSPLTVA
ncbi:MAG: SDR family oxidoreductase [Betaproteobacteria bacterium]|nr:SDR family oxidoreductase [Betaproteobacteria bacterium]